MPRGFLQLLPDGPQVELIGPVTRIGRGQHCEMQLDSGRLSREHSMVLRRARGFWAADLRSSYGTWIASGGPPSRIGSEVRRLRDGDVIGLGPQVRFSSGPQEPVETERVAAVIAAPEDPGRWRAYAELLLLQNDPKAERILSASTSPQWETPEEVSLNIEWSHGHVRSAVIRELRHSGNALPELLFRFLWAPATELMVELEIDLLPGAAREVDGTLAQRLLEGARRALERSDLPALRRLSVRGFTVGALSGSPLL